MLALTEGGPGGPPQAWTPAPLEAGFPQHFLYFRPEWQGQGWLRPGVGTTWTGDGFARVEMC